MVSYKSKRFVILLLIILWQHFSGLTMVGAAEKYTVLIIQSMKNPHYTEAFNGFKEVLQKSSFSFRFVEYNLEGEEKKLREILRRINISETNLILTIGSLATESVVKNSLSIPTVFAMVLDPSASGLTGKGITGASLNIPYRTQFAKIKQLLPTIKTLGTFYYPPETGRIIKEALPAAREMGLAMKTYAIEYPHIFPNKVKMALGEVDAIWMIADSFMYSKPNTQHLILKAVENKVPLIGLSPNYVKAGALMALEVNYQDNGRQAGEICLKIVGGIKPADIPIAFARKIRLAVNRQIAHNIGVNIPHELLGDIRFVQ
jgi:putative tryptophan/tyrosine transport system substrate-binding protein